MVNSKKISKAILSSNHDKGLVPFLAAHDLLSVLPNVLRRIEGEARRQSDRKTLKIKTSAKSSIEPHIENSIRNKMGAGGAPIHIDQDAKLSAGFVARYQGFMFDTSAQSQLHKLKKSIKHK